MGDWIASLLRGRRAARVPLMTVVVLGGLGLLTILQGFVFPLLRAQRGAAQEAAVSAARDTTSQPPQVESTVRIVALSPAIAESARRLGIGKLLVGRHGFDAWSDAALIVCGDQSGLDAEALLRAKPTHVYLEWGSRSLPGPVATIAAEQGWKVDIVTLLTLAQIRALIVSMLVEFREHGVDQGVLVRWDEAVGPRTAATAAERGKLGRVLVLYGDRQPVAAAGPGACQHELLGNLGFTHALGEGAAYQILDRERLLELTASREGEGGAPVVVVLKPRPARALLSGSEEIASRRAAIDPETVRRALGLRDETRIVVIDEAMAMVPGLNLIDLSADLEQRLLALVASDDKGK